MQSCYEVGDFSGALTAAEVILEHDPEDVEANRYAQSCRDVLTQMFSARLAPLDRVVSVAISPEQIRWLSLDHKSGFLLSLVDGNCSIEELLDVASSGPLLLALIARNLKVRYKRSVFGVLWTMAQPATVLLVLTLIFAQEFAPRASTYALYLAPGLILWHFFAQTTSIVIAEVASGVELWRRVRMPKTALAIATTSSGLLNLAMATRGAEQVAGSDFTLAFFAVALLAASSALVYLQLAADAGAAVSGQAPQLTTGRRSGIRSERDPAGSE